ncbi:Basement membrane proteoglycan [Dirofilaria immitis]
MWTFLLKYFILCLFPKFIKLRNELQTTSLAAQDDQVDRFLIEAEQPTQWETITVTKQAEGNVKPAIRRMESQNLEADEREDVVLVIPVDRFTEEGRNEKWAGVGNLNMWKWLTLEKVDMLNKLFKATNDIALILEKTYAQLLMTDGGLREMAVRSFRETCNELLRVLLGDRNYYLIADMYNFGRTSEEINEKLNQFYMRLSKTNKKYVDMMAPTCKLIYNIYGSPAIRHPRRINEDNLFVKQIHWFTREQETEIETILAEGARNENLLTEMLDYYENLDSLSQEKVSEELKRICQNRVKQLFGTDGLELLKFMNKESISIELLVAKFAQLVENLTNENQRTEADQISIFCQKIYGIERFDLGKLTSWLSPDQKTELGHLIHDRDISDDAVYERIFEFYEKAEHKKKMDAQKIIESECKRFVRRMFGNEIATKLEEHRSDGNFTAQMLSAELATYAAEIKDKKNRIKAGKSIPICNRIYLGYKGDCFCNGHSSICSPFTHECLNCADNTFGVQCEKCLDGFEGSALMGEIGCIPAERNNEFAECICNKHSSQCNENGECFFCLHNTTGIQCENCAEGFYGDATQGTVEDCIPCPCPDGGDCFINGDALVECRTCPNGTYGSTCELRLESGTTRITEIIA